MSSSQTNLFTSLLCSRRALSLASLLVLVGQSACSEAAPGDMASGGTFPATGGGASDGAGELSSGGGTAVGGSGGVLGSGGDATTGGAPSSGGASGSGGVPQGGSGGAPGAGGLGSSGGETGAGGTPATGGATATGGSGGEGFSPCPAAEPCKILPLGDSITFGLGFDGGYRVELFRLAVSAQHDITFTGTQPPNGPSMVEGMPFPRNHAGISGQLIAEIDGRVPSPDLGEMPHIILVHAGTNDLVRSPNGATERLGALMDSLIVDAPDALLVFSNLIPLGIGTSVDSFNAPVEDMVNERAAAGAHIIFVDQFEGFPTSELGDQVHPNEAGYARMAGKWFDAIESYLP